jgi:hypothetical protein
MDLGRTALEVEEVEAGSLDKKVLARTRVPPHVPVTLSTGIP